MCDTEHVRYLGIGLLLTGNVYEMMDVRVRLKLALETVAHVLKQQSD